jgi:hypothetical protein
MAAGRPPIKTLGLPVPTRQTGGHAFGINSHAMFLIPVSLLQATNWFSHSLARTTGSVNGKVNDFNGSTLTIILFKMVQY